MRLLLLLLLLPLLLSACVRAHRDLAPPAPQLQRVVDQLAREAPEASPGTDLAIAVEDLTTGEYAALNDQVPHVSASSAKVLWVAAALSRVGISPVEPHAEPIFMKSDNLESGEVIDLIGPNAVNDYYAQIGLKHTALTSWGYGKPRKATNSPNELDGNNYFTAADVVSFLARLDRGELLGAAPTGKLRYWLSLTPRQGCGGWLGALLPEPTRPALLHKAGWLPPGCCSSDEVYNTLTEIGLVQVPGGHRYAVAILARRGKDYWGRQAPFVEHASCLLYRTIAREPDLSCDAPPRDSTIPAECE